MNSVVTSMDPSLESTIFGILSFEGKCNTSLSKEIHHTIGQIKEKCKQAQASEGSTSINWRKQGSNAGNSSNKAFSNNRSSNTTHFAGNPGNNSTSLRWRTDKQDNSNNNYHSSHGGFDKVKNERYDKNEKHEKPDKPYVKYVSKFQNSDTPVEDKILNQIILNKLNKFSASNYDEVKAFLQQILDSDEKEFLQAFIKLVFKKAACEPTFCPLYAKMIADLSQNYKTLRDELTILYNKYLTIFEEVSETECKDYETFVQRNREKQHRHGYSQFLAELTRLDVLGLAELEVLYITIFNQIKIHSKNTEGKQQLLEEYVDCLLQMTKAFQKGNTPTLLEIRKSLSAVCEPLITDFLTNRSTQYPGLSKKASFGMMDCLDIFRGNTTFA